MYFPSSVCLNKHIGCRAYTANEKQRRRNLSEESDPENWIDLNKAVRCRTFVWKWKSTGNKIMKNACLEARCGFVTPLTAGLWLHPVRPSLVFFCVWCLTKRECDFKYAGFFFRQHQEFWFYFPSCVSTYHVFRTTRRTLTSAASAIFTIVLYKNTHISHTSGKRRHFLFVVNLIVL